jgi:hypothetical protein
MVKLVWLVTLRELLAPFSIFYLCMYLSPYIFKCSIPFNLFYDAFFFIK